MTTAQQYCRERAAAALERATAADREARNIVAVCAYTCARIPCTHQRQLAAAEGQAAAAREDAERWRVWADDPEAAARAAPREQLALF
jgi:hypothetical protein